MKQIVLAAMVMMTVASGATADIASDWDYFWGTTLNPANTGWNDFWYQCQDPNKGVGDCIGTVAAGIGFAAALPVAIIATTAVAAGVVAGGTSAAIVTAPVSALYFTSAGTLVTVPSGGTIVGMTPATLTISGAWMAV